MSKNVILIEDVDRKESNLEEFVYQKSKGGKIGLTEDDIKKISPDDRIRAIHLLEIYQRHPETFKNKKIESEEKPKPVTPVDVEKFWDRLPKAEKNIFLQELFERDQKAIQTAKKKRMAALPEDIRNIVNMSQESWNKLPKNGQELILEKFSQL